MKRSEVLEKYRNEIEKAMVDCYKSVLAYGGRIRYRIYVDEGGEISTLEQVQGDNARYVDDDLYDVCLIEMPNYDPWDGSIDGRPEDDEEAEREEKELNDWAVSEYESELSAYLYDEMIAKAKRDEKYYDA